jgi:hypothetical protein
MQTMWRNLAAATLLVCSLTPAGAQQRPSALDQLPGRIGERSQVPEHGGMRGTGTSTADDLIRKQTAAIVELSERIGRLEKRVAALEARRDNR